MPRFSVVVPTRNRPEFVRHCLETVAAQTFRDFEVIVQDNSDSPALVSEEQLPLTDPGKVRYQFNRRVLAMSANWEKAVERSAGEYVLVVGDDDGLYPTCLESADRLIRANDLDALRWGQSVFFWPDPENGKRGSVDIPGDRGYVGGERENPYTRGWSQWSPQGVAMRVLRGEAHYGLLPMIYTGCVSRKVLDRIKATAGRYFPTRFPDLWCGLAVCATAERVGWLQACLAIGGSTPTSTGAHLFCNAEGDPVCEEFERLAEEAGLYWHADVAGDFPLAAQLHDTYLWVRDTIGWPDGFPAFDKVLPAEPVKAWFAPADVLECKTVADVARFCHAFTRGVPPEVQIEELRAEVVKMARRQVA